MILVTGASGQLGSLTLQHLRGRQAPAIGASRTPGPAGRAMSFDDPATLDLRDVTTLVLVSAGYAEDDVVIARHQRVVEAARRDGVEHIVYTSVVGEGDHLGFALAHRATERMITASGMAWTILRNGLYAELIGDLLGWQDGVLQSPFGEGRVAAPARDDLARAAATVALSPERHSGRIYELTGPAFGIVGIGHVLDASIHDLSVGDYRDQLASSPGLLPFQAPMLLSIATAMRHGFLSTHHSDLAGLLEREPQDGLGVAAAAAASARAA